MSLVASSEGNAEHSKEVAVGGLGLHVCLDSGVPLLDEGAKLISSDVQSVEVGVDVKSFHFFGLYSYFSPGLLLSVALQVGERDFEHSVSKRVGGDLCKQLTQGQKRAQVPMRSARIYLLCPAVLLQGVIVGTLVSKTLGTWTLYHSFLMKG